MLYSPIRTLLRDQAHTETTSHISHKRPVPTFIRASAPCWTRGVRTHAADLLSCIDCSVTYPCHYQLI